MEYIITILLSYLVGSIPTALILSKMKNIDIRKHGSGNIGATNSFRVLGKKIGFVVTFVDILKGVIPALLAYLYGGDLLAVVAAFAVVIGHSFSIFANFKGGKGIATGAGAVMVLNPLAVILGISLFVILLFLTKYASVSSIIAASSVAILTWISDDTLVIKLGVTLLVGFVIFRHHSNISRLIRGKENKVLQKKK